MDLSLSAPDITEHEIEAVVSVLRSDRLSLGPWMERFEEAVCAWVGVPHGIAVSSGTAGLHLCLVAMGIGPGDEVIVPSFAFIAAANAVRYVGATPVFCDVESASLNADAASVAAAITPRTRVLLIVHTFGRTAAMGPLMQLARRHGLRVIEDACEALGATCNGQQAGSFGDAAVFAFYPNKQITTGEGGMVVTPHAPLAATVRALRNQGRSATDDWHQHSVLGYNYRLSELQCALGTAQMNRLPEILRKREQVAALYAEALRDTPGLALLAPDDAAYRRSWFVYIVRMVEAAGAPSRDVVAQRLQQQGIPTGRYFAPIHEQPAYRDFPKPQPLPVTERESRRTLALPFFSRLTAEEVAHVAHALCEALQ